ncbi:MAG TPA: ABC transporter permease [Symbiobacteriaceae bacterium]
MRALIAIYVSTARQFRRDWMALLFTVLLPLIMAAFFGLIFGTEPASPGGVPMAQLYVPAMLSLGILWLGIFGTAPPLVQLREHKVFRRVGATPLPRPILLAGQLSFRVTTGLIQAAILITYGIIAYRMEIRGSWPLLLLVTLLGTLLFVTMGCLIAAVARSGDSSVALGQVVQFPMMFLSGTLFPLEMLPGFLRPAAAVMPLTYLTDALKQTMLGAPALYPLWLDLTVLGSLLLLLALLSVRLFRWE